MSIHPVHANPGKGSPMLPGTPVTGKHARRCIQIPRDDVPFGGFGHKLKKKLTPNTWAANLHDGVIYLYSETYGFAETDARSMVEAHLLLGDVFLLADPGILVAPKKVFSPNLAHRMVGIRMGVDQHGDDVIAHILCSKESTKDFRKALPSFRNQSRSPVPNETAYPQVSDSNVQPST